LDLQRTVKKAAIPQVLCSIVAKVNNLFTRNKNGLFIEASADGI